MGEKVLNTKERVCEAYGQESMRLNILPGKTVPLQNVLSPAQTELQAVFKEFLKPCHQKGSPVSLRVSIHFQARVTGQMTSRPAFSQALCL